MGLPNSGGITSILWSLAIGANLPDPSPGLKAFEAATAAILARANTLLDAGSVSVEVDTESSELRIDSTVVRATGIGWAVLAKEHTRLALLQAGGRVVGGSGEDAGTPAGLSIRSQVGAMKIREMMDLAYSLEDEDRALLCRGSAPDRSTLAEGLSRLAALLR